MSTDDEVPPVLYIVYLPGLRAEKRSKGTTQKTEEEEASQAAYIYNIFYTLSLFHIQNRRVIVPVISVIMSCRWEYLTNFLKIIINNICLTTYDALWVKGDFKNNSYISQIKNIII